MPSVALECRGVSKSFGGLCAVDCLSAEFERGRVTALIGPNGAGKTTLFHLMSGALHPDDGDVCYGGKTINGLSPWEVTQLGVGRLFQDVRVFSKLTALENVLIGFPGQAGESAITALFRPAHIAAQERVNVAEAERLLAFVGLEAYAGEPAENLSYGQQKLLAIARLLAARADVLLLDEPTAGVNPVLIESLLRLIRNLALEGRAVVLIEHNMSVVLEVADWVYFMDQGQIVAFGLPDEVLADPSVRARYLGLSRGSENQ